MPAWFLPNGRINASESQLEEASSSSEWWAIGFGGLVIVSVVVEFVISFMEPPYATFLFDSMFTDAGIALGVVGEVAFGIWDSRIQTELRRRSNVKLAEANERAAAAELETARLRKELAWRRLSEQQIEKISEILSRPDAPKLGLRIELAANDAESSTFAQDIASVFRKNGWPVLLNFFTPAPSFFGITVPVYAPPSYDACIIVRAALSNAGIRFTGDVPPMVGGMRTGAGDDLTEACAVIHLGSKPMPNLG